MSKPFTSILMGSDSGLPRVEPAIDILDKPGITRDVSITSAHRTPAATHQYVTEADGMAARLTGTVSALTVKPVQENDAQLQAQLYG